MKCQKEEVRIGTRFYIFESEDEYRIRTLVYSKSDDKGKFMDEETFEIIEIDRKTLENDYTMLIEYNTCVIVNYRLKDELKDQSKYASKLSETMWLMNNDVIAFSNNPDSIFYENNIVLIINVYRFMRKSVFNKLINYIVTLNNNSIDEENLNCVWKLYMDFISLFNDDIFDYSEREDLNMDNIMDKDNPAILPKDIFMEIEDSLKVSILVYTVYVMDDSIDLSNVSRTHFFIFSNDRFYIVLYTADPTKEIIKERHNLKSHMDVVKFMLK